LKKSATTIWKKEIEEFSVVVCHFVMRAVPRSHFNSRRLYGHSHGKLPPIGEQEDIGVDNNDFYPARFNESCETEKKQPDNPNFVKNMPA